MEFARAGPEIEQFVAANLNELDDTAVEQQEEQIRPKIDGLNAAIEYFTKLMSIVDTSSESLWVTHLDAELRWSYTSYHCGDESTAEIPLKQIIADITKYSTVGLVLAHNHPSGDPRPSDSDVRATRRLATVTDALNCTILDHLIFGRGSWTSLRRMGLL